ncbi:transposase [Gemmobacter lanyuensis]
MSVTMDDGIKRWTAKRKAALVVEIIQGKTTVAEASRAYDLSPSEIEGWVDDAKRGWISRGPWPLMGPRKPRRWPCVRTRWRSASSMRSN